MNNATTIEVTVERIIPAPPGKVFDAWLNPKVPGTPWNMADKLLFTPTVDGFFYWAIRGTPHYGRFTAMERATLLAHTWMSPNTSGLESTVTVTFRAQGQDTVMTLRHAGLPDTDGGRSHAKGWNFFLDGFQSEFATSSAA